VIGGVCHKSVASDFTPGFRFGDGAIQLQQRIRIFPDHRDLLLTKGPQMGVCRFCKLSPGARALATLIQWQMNTPRALDKGSQGGK
jgi:hypothetical protein